MPLHPGSTLLPVYTHHLKYSNNWKDPHFLWVQSAEHTFKTVDCQAVPGMPNKEAGFPACACDGAAEYRANMESLVSCRFSWLLGAGWLKKLSSSAERPLLLSASFLSDDGEVLIVEEAAGEALKKLLKISSPPEVLAPAADKVVPTGVSVIKQDENFD